MNQQNLWAPWRMAYLRELDRRAKDAGDKKQSGASPGNFFAAYWAAPEQDEQNLIVHRNEHGMILLNRYPYASGHLLVALGEPRSRLLDYEPQQRIAFWNLVDEAVDLADRTLNPQGIHIGINEGQAAGAGVPEHLHAHIIPRWHGDTNFITTVGQVRIIPEALENMAKRYRDAGENV